MAAPRRTKRTKAEPAAGAVVAPPRRPMAMARRVSLFERQVVVKLSPVAVDILLGAGATLTEGGVTDARYQGSTMVTIDLARTALAVSDPLDAATARRVAELYPTDERARARARALAVAEATRAAGCALSETVVDVRAAARGRAVHLDLELEARASTPAAPSRAAVGAIAPRRNP
ncbi:MAG: hypothetical protein R2939_15160 [Kofleriaceae bacterium]